MSTVLFSAPTLAQVSLVQTALAPLNWNMMKTSAWRRALHEANGAFPGEGTLKKSALVMLSPMGDVGYLFRYKSDPVSFARLVIKDSQRICPDFEFNKDCSGGSVGRPLVIAFHEPSPRRVRSRLYVKVKSLVPVAAREGEYMEVEGLRRNSNAARLIENLLWAGLGVFPEKPA
jgi:hypothetical protein